MIPWHLRSGTIVRLDGERLRGLRESQGLTQVELAEQVGCSAAAVSTWESEKRCPRLAQCEALRLVFGKALAESGALELTK